MLIIDNKRRRCWARGFTLAEILITLVIIGLIGALSIPLLAPNKKSPSKVKSPHGTVECLWVNGEVKAWYSDNGEHKSGQLISAADGIPDADGASSSTIPVYVMGDACYARLPKASTYIFQAIGAGGTGAKGLGVPSIEETSVDVSGYIPTDEKFLSTISDTEKVPDWVRTLWPYIWKARQSSGEYYRVHYSLVSPMGSSGDAVCHYYRRITDECDQLCIDVNAMSCTSSCYAWNWASGGDSGQIAEYDIATTLQYGSGNNDDVQYTISNDKTELSISPVEHYTLIAARSGTNAKLIDSNMYPGLHGGPYILDTTSNPFVYPGKKNVRIQNKYRSDGVQRGGQGCDDISGKPGKPGSISVNPTYIKYAERKNGIIAKFGLAGEPGEVTKKIMERIPSREVRLEPVKVNHDAGSATLKESKIYLKSGGDWKLLISAKSGLDKAATTGTYEVNKDKDMPFPSIYYPDAFKAKESALYVNSNLGYKSYISELSTNLKPGVSGAGSHGLYTEMDYVEKNRLFFWGNSSTPMTLAGTAPSEPIHYSVPKKCFDGIVTEAEYCGASDTAGQSGGAVVSW